MDSKILISGVFFIFILLSGFWLSHLGRPVNTILLTAHKLISIGAVVFLAINIYRIHLVTPLSSLQIAVSVGTILLFLVMVVTGGLLSVDKVMPEIVHKIHQFTPYLVILSTAATLYFLLIRKQ
jgi:hypothetical protein